MYRKIKKTIEWLEFEQLAEFPEIVHGVFLRNNWDSSSVQNPQIFAQKRLEVFSIFGIQNAIEPNICHGKKIEIVISAEKLVSEGCDGLITKSHHLGLFVTHADCQAAIFYDPIKKVIANIHCGWRGNVQNIYAKTVLFFQEHFHSRPENLLVCISPSLGPDAAEFIHYQKELPIDFLPYQVKPLYFDLWEISKAQLLEAKVLEEHIEIAKICTYQNKNDFFSYRREKKTGRNATLVAMRKI